MKGLFIKDFFCLKRTLKMILLVSICTITLAVLFSLSSEYGNISHALKELSGLKKTGEAQNAMTEEEFYAFYRYAIWIVLFIPMAFMANILDCFSEDKRAGFNKVLFSMPVNAREIAGARYLVSLVYAGIGGLASCIAALCVSFASKQVVFIELISVVMVFLGIMMMFISVIMPLVYLLGAEKKDMLQIATIVLFVLMIILGIKSLWDKNKGLYSGNLEEVVSNVMKKTVEDINNIFITKGWIFIGVGILMFVLSYVISTRVIQRKGLR